MRTIEDASTLIGALVTYNADPYLIETDEQAEEVYNDIKSNGLTPITLSGDELAKLDLTEGNNVTALYSFGSGIICFASDWTF